MKNIRDKIYIPRILEGKILRLLDTPEIIAVFGARQVGNTTLIRRVYNGLSDKSSSAFPSSDTTSTSLIVSIFHPPVGLFYQGWMVLGNCLKFFCFVPDHTKLIKASKV